MTRRSITPLIAAAVVVVLSSGRPAAAQAWKYRSDLQIQSQIVHSLADKDVQGVAVDVRHGVVTLTGSVRSLRVLEKTLNVVQNQAEGARIVNHVTITAAASDAVVAERVMRDVHKSRLYTVFDEVSVAVDRGVVRLTGRVVMPMSVEEFEWLASGTDGVQDVKCQLRLLPLSDADDHLRLLLAMAIYGDAALGRYALEEDPPIHIIVEKGRVTLVGKVASDIDRRSAESLARFTRGVVDVDNQLVVEVLAH
jgi:hyperosmotically inducible protein